MSAFCSDLLRCYNKYPSLSGRHTNYLILLVFILSICENNERKTFEVNSYLKTISLETLERWGRNFRGQATPKLLWLNLKVQGLKSFMSLQRQCLHCQKTVKRMCKNPQIKWLKKPTIYLLTILPSGLGSSKEITLLVWAWVTTWSVICTHDSDLKSKVACWSICCLLGHQVALCFWPLPQERQHFSQVNRMSKVKTNC